MTMFELWDRDSGNLLGSFESRKRALAVVREQHDLNGVRGILGLVLGEVEKGGRTHRIAEGAALLAMADARRSKVPALVRPMAMVGGVVELLTPFERQGRYVMKAASAKTKKVGRAVAKSAAKISHESERGTFVSKPRRGESPAKKSR